MIQIATQPARQLVLKVLFPDKKNTVKRSLQMDYSALFNPPAK